MIRRPPRSTQIRSSAASDVYKRQRKYEDFENNFIELSKKTFDNFQEMIPSNFKKLWTDGIENEDYYLKLCGSGGGGFLIGFTRDIDTIDKYFPKKNFEVLLRF